MSSTSKHNGVSPANARGNLNLSNSMKSNTKGMKGIDSRIAKIPAKRNYLNEYKTPGSVADSPRYSEAGSRKDFQMTQGEFNKSRFKK